VAKDATAAEIKKSYFQLARQYHPDSNKNPSAKDKFIEIQQAYDTLGDEKKRAAYDRYGAASQQPGFDPDAFANARGPFGAGGFGGFQDFASAFAGANGSGSGAQSELFEQLFGAFGGGSRARTQRFRGEDIQNTVHISFIEACKGVSRTINVKPIVDCNRCSGSGIKAGAKRSKCHTCGGTGTQSYIIDSGFQVSSTCTTCQGRGTFINKDAQCGDCGGVGRVRTEKPVSFDIPPGVEDGMVIRVAGAGDRPVGGSGTTGDLLIQVQVASSRQFRRQGSNLLQSVKVPLHTALLGGRVRVPTLDGEVDIKVAAGTQPGEECVLKGRGVPSVRNGSKGDMFVSFQVQIPRTLNRRQRELIEQYADEAEGRTSETPRGSKNEDGTGHGSGGKENVKDQKGKDKSSEAGQRNARLENDTTDNDGPGEGHKDKQTMS